MITLDYQKLCKEAGIDWAMWNWCSNLPDNSLAEQLVKFAEAVIEEHQKSDALLKACIAVDRDFEQSGAVSEETVEKVREAISEAQT